MDLQVKDGHEEPNLTLVRKVEFNEDTKEYDFLEHKVDLRWDIPTYGKEIPIDVNGMTTVSMTMTIEEAKGFVDRLHNQLTTQLERL